MQTLISLPEVDAAGGLIEWERMLFRKVSGVPLLLRVMATALKGGAQSFLIVHPSAVAKSWLMTRLRSPLIQAASIETLAVDSSFDPHNPEHWTLLEGSLQSRFLWFPWNYVTMAPALRVITKTPVGPEVPASWSVPAMVNREALGKSDRPLSTQPTPTPQDIEGLGVSVESHKDVREAERLLVRGSGKATDGIYSKFNRRLCWPLVRWLSKTPITANMVTWAGLPVVALSGYWYSKGYWGAYAMGGLLYFLSVLLDEVDGMLARIKFQESPFGCWLETAVDYTGYLFLWFGMSFGLYREYSSSLWLTFGGLMILSNVATFLVLVRQRKLFAPADQPENYQKRFYGRLESDTASTISRIIRKIVFLAKKGVMCHYVLFFSVVGLLPVLFWLAFIGSVLTLLISLYMNRLFLLPVSGRAAKLKESST